MALFISDDGRVFRHNIGVSERVWNKIYFPLVGKHCFSLFPVLLRPKSRGFIKLRSRDPHDPPIIDPKYLSHSDDVITMVNALRLTMKVGETPPMRRLGAKLVKTVVPGN